MLICLYAYFFYSQLTTHNSQLTVHFSLLTAMLTGREKDDKFGAFTFFCIYADFTTMCFDDVVR